MATVLLTGGAGFFGGILKHQLLQQGYTCVSIDLEPDEDEHPQLIKIKGDIRDKALLTSLFAQHRFETVFHIAAQLAHGSTDKNLLWSSNVEATELLATLAVEHGVRHFVFTSSNCLWAKPAHYIKEDEPPAPAELYGQSKLAGEQILNRYFDQLHVTMIRCPTIIDSGRLGLLGILFEFIYEGKNIWVVGQGDNKYQFIAAPDLANACILASKQTHSAIYNIGSDNVPSLRQVYEYVINKARSQSKVKQLPKKLTLFCMKLAYQLHLSPLGPYHYKMIAEEFIFDTSKIKTELHWQPTLTNQDMLWNAYQYYVQNKTNIENRTHVSAHKQVAAMGIIKWLKWLS